MNYKSIIISSPPRTGSTWTLNILKEIFINKKINIIPQKVPRNDTDALKYHFKNINENKINAISIIKIEQILKKELTKKTKIIVNFRDPRDAVISYKYFMQHKNLEFKDLFQLIKKFINWIEYYRKNFNKDQLLEISFHDINNNPLKIFQQLESFLNFKIDKKSIDRIINKYTKSEVLNLIKKKENFVRDNFNKNKKLNDEDIVMAGNKIIRAFDITTGFQTGHILNSDQGDWKKNFSTAEIKIINVNFKDWFKKNNLYN